jgi:hypothetical protein
MKKTGTMIAALLAGAAFAPGAAQAQTRGGFEVGVELFDYSYRERMEGQTVVRDDGRFVGLTLGYVGKLGDGWFLRGRLSGAAGSVDTGPRARSSIPTSEEVPARQRLPGHRQLWRSCRPRLHAFRRHLDHAVRRLRQPGPRRQ